MKLVELAGAKKFQNRRAEEIVELLGISASVGRTSLKFVANGANGVVMTDGKKAYKFWHKDSAYEKFVKAAKEIGGPWLPKFYSDVKTLPKMLNIGPDNRGDVKYVKIELLQPHRGGHGFKVWKDPKVLDFLEVHAAHPDMANFISYSDMFEWAPTASSGRELLKNLIFNLEHVNDLPKKSLQPFLEKMNPDVIAMADVVNKLAQLVDHDEHAMDYNRGNVMLRGSQPVIVDPFMSHEDVKDNHYIMSELKRMMRRP